MWHLLSVASLSIIAMVIQDIFGILMVQAEARFNPKLTWKTDSLMMYATMTTQTIYITILQGHDLKSKAVIVVALTIGNIIGAYTAMPLGRKLASNEKPHCTCCKVHAIKEVSYADF